MANSRNSKISELVELTDPSNSDYIPIVDTVNQETKKISYTSLVTAINEDDDSYSKTESDVLISAVQADVDQNELDANAAISNANAAIAVIQADVDQNASAIAVNTSRLGLTPEQADAIELNKLTQEQIAAVELNTLKVGITQEQADAITANTTKVGITQGQADAITANTTKVGITQEQADAITANTAITDITPTFSQTMEQTANYRPVGTSMLYKIYPKSEVTNTSTDFHGIDLNMITYGSHMADDIRLYPFEVHARHNTNQTLGKIVPMYSLWNNTGDGDVDSVNGLRMWGKNTGTGTISDARFISIAPPENSGGGEINGLRGLVIESMSDTFSDAMGIESFDVRNYFAGAKVGNSEVEQTIFRNQKDGVRFGPSGGFSIANGYNCGTTDLSWSRVVAFDDYTPSADSNVWSTHSAGNNRIEIKILTSGVWRLVFTDNAGSVANYDIAPSASFVNGVEYRVTIAFDRDGVATLYRDHLALGSVDVSASVGIDVGNGNTNESVFYTDANLSLVDCGGVIFNYVLTDVALRCVRPDFLSLSDRWGLTDSLLHLSDWSVGVDGWSGTRAALVSNQSIGGVDECLMFYPSTITSSGKYVIEYGLFTPGDLIRLTVDLYVPSGQSNVNGCQVKANGVSQLVIDARSSASPDGGANGPLSLGTWETRTVEIQTGAGWSNSMSIHMTTGAGATFTPSGLSTDDNVFVKNLRIESLSGATASHPMNEGLGGTLHDASTNELDATIVGTHAHLDPKQSLKLRTPPAAANSIGAVGQWAVGSGYRYDCIAVDTWKRVAIATW